VLFGPSILVYREFITNKAFTDPIKATAYRNPEARAGNGALRVSNQGFIERKPADGVDIQAVKRSENGFVVLEFPKAHPIKHFW
jgi:hypothetical protein